MDEDVFYQLWEVQDNKNPETKIALHFSKTSNEYRVVVRNKHHIFCEEWKAGYTPMAGMDVTDAAKFDEITNRLCEQLDKLLSEDVTDKEDKNV